MYSRGSAIPLFISRIRSGKPITITDPTITRFLISVAESVDLVAESVDLVAESVDLVAHAFEIAETGDLYVRKDPASTIEVLAKAQVERFGRADNEVQTIEFRHGEKLYKSLLSTEERAKAEDLGDYFRVPLDSRDPNYSEYFEGVEPRQASLETYTFHDTKHLDVEGVKTLLLAISEVRQELGL
jgi:UDP-glucose 4-epimerase